MSWDDLWPHSVTVYSNDWDQIEIWCDENLGKFDEAWYKLGIDPAEQLVTGKCRTVWYFKKEKDAMLFILRWQ